MRAFVAAVLMTFSATAVLAQDFGETAIPERRAAISRDVDLPGGDIASYFDTTLDACQAACLAEAQCTAFTYNQRSSSCFIKADAGAPVPFAGAISAQVVVTDPAIVTQGAGRTADLAFLEDDALTNATALARDIGRYHAADGFGVEELIRAAQQAAQANDLMGAFRFTGAALSQSDDFDLWLRYATLGRTATSADTSETNIARSRVLPAFINTYLRSRTPQEQAQALGWIATTLEAEGRGRLAIPALRLANDLVPSDGLAASLDRMIGLFGFRVAETQVDSDSATPRICVIFTEALVQAGVDYAPFVQMPEADFTVDVSDAQLCVDGVTHGNRYRVVLRPGLPAASGETLVRPVELTLYVRDRSPSVRFINRAYVLPRLGDVAIPVESVNLTEVDLTLRRLTDRNILRSMQDGFFGGPLYDWDQSYFDNTMGQVVWEGAATVEQDLNRDILTRLPLTRALEGQPAGLYVLSAAVPGADPEETPAASQWFVLSDLGLTTMSGNDGLTVSVRSLGETAAVTGAEVTLLSRANDVLGTAQTDVDGIARFDVGLTRGTGSSEPALVTVTQGDDLAFLSLTDPAFDLSDRGVDGREPAGPMDVFLATDRGAYRAGEVINLVALMRDGTAAALSGVPLTAILIRPDGVEYSRIASATDLAGGHVFALPVGATAPRGSWTIEVLADVDAPALATTQVLVEDFLPERIDFDIVVPERVALLDGIIPVSLTALYLFGPPAADLPVEGEVLLSAATSLPEWPGYVFGLYDEPFDARMESIPRDWVTGPDGAVAMDLPLPFIEGGVTQPLTATLNLRVTEGSGRPVERQTTTMVLPDQQMVAVKPLFDGVVGEGSAASFEIIGLNPDLTAAPMTLQYTVNRVDTWYQWYQLYGSWNWEPTTERTRVAQEQVVFDGTPVEVSVPVEWGQYEIVVERVDGPYAAASTSFYAGWYAPAGADPTPDLLEASMDAASYAVGDTATFRIVPRYAGTAIISVLTDRVVSLQTVQVTEGENLIALPVTADWGAGAYVTATVLRPMEVAADRNPTRALGLVYAAVDPADRQLSVVIEAPLQAAPRAPLTVAIDVQGGVPGQTAYVTLAAVDVGILNLTGFSAPDPSAYYFGQRKLGVELRDLYGRLIDGMTGAMGSVRTGGDAVAQMGTQAPPPTEELVAYFQGPVQVDAEGRATVTFDLPSFNGTVRLMAVAWSERGVGQASMDVLVRDPVVVTASVPRFMAPGDGSRLLLEIVHAEGPSGDMALSVTSDGLSLGSGVLPTSITLQDGGKATLSIPVLALDPGLHEITVTLTTPDGTVLTKVLTIPVQVNDPAIANTLRLAIAPGETFTFDDAVFAEMMPGTGTATLSVGALARLDAPGLLNILDRYPYGCTEQVTSQAMPLLYLDEVATAMGLATRDQIALRVQQSITEVLANQSATGAFGLWGPYSGDLWLDAYVTDFLSRARASGYAVPDIAWRTAVDNLTNRVNYYPDFEVGGEDIAYALMVLARESEAAVGDLRYFADERAFAFTTPLASAQLGAALAYYGDQRRADAMFGQAMTQLGALPPERGGSLWRVDYGSSRRDAAAVLALAVEVGSTAVDRDELTTRLAGAGQLISTQEAAWTLIAANALLGDLQAGDITVNGAIPQGPVVQVRAADAGLVPMAIANNGTAATDVTITVIGVPVVPEPAGGNGYAIERAYYTMDGNPVSTDKVPSGARLVAVLTVRPLGRQEGRLMVNDPLPAGFEIDNPNLIRAGDLSGLEWLETIDGAHSEVRQDRFLTAVDWYGDQPFRLAYIVRAVSPGTFRHPAASVEDMYRPQFRAHTDASVVTVTE